MKDRNGHEIRIGDVLRHGNETSAVGYTVTAVSDADAEIQWTSTASGAERTCHSVIGADAAAMYWTVSRRADGSEPGAERKAGRPVLDDAWIEAISKLPPTPPDVLERIRREQAEWLGVGRGLSVADIMTHKPLTLAAFHERVTAYLREHAPAAKCVTDRCGAKDEDSFIEPGTRVTRKPALIAWITFAPGVTDTIECPEDSDLEALDALLPDSVLYAREVLGDRAMGKR